MDNIRTLASAKGESFRMLGLSLTQSGLQEYVEAHGINFPTYVIGDMESVRSLDLGSTPQTLVVSSDGKIEKNWIGAFSGELHRDVETYFQVKLPGLRLD